MDFTHAVLRDVAIYTLPFFAARTAVFPIVNMNSKMQRNHMKHEEEAGMKQKYQKYQSFAWGEKLAFYKDTVSMQGIRGAYEKYENYIVPFMVSRIAEGFVYFPLMRFCLDILKLEDPFYLLTGLVFFVVNLVGAFFLKYFGDIMRQRKGLKSAVTLLAPSNTPFWKQYEIDLGYYHAYGLIQGYTQLITFWYLKPGFRLEIILFTISRVTASLFSQPLAILAQWGSDYEFNHEKVLQQVIKRDGYFGLFAGFRDIFVNEIIFSCVLIPGCHLVASLI